MKSAPDIEFKQNYESHLKHLRLKGLQPKTIDAYARAIRRIGAYFDHHIDALSEPQLIDYFTDRLASHSWSAVRLDLYGLKFYYTHVLRKPWVAVDLIKPPPRPGACRTSSRSRRAASRRHHASSLRWIVAAYSSLCAR